MDTLFGFTLALSDPHGAGELVAALCEFQDRATEILNLATATLRSALELERESEMIDNDHDINDSTVSSIEKHAQNEYGEGVNFLVRVLADSLPQAALWTGTIREKLSVAGRICPDELACVFASMLCEMLNSSTQTRPCRLYCGLPMSISGRSAVKSRCF